MERIDKLIRTLYRNLDKLLYREVMSHLTDSFNISDGVVKNTVGNYTVIEKLEKVLDRFSRPLQRIKNVLKKEFNDNIKKETFKYTKRKEVFANLAKGAARSIDSNVSLSQPIQQVKQRVGMLMAKPGGADLRLIRESLFDMILTNKLVEKQLTLWTQNAYMQYERAGGDIARKEVGLKHAVYSGGLIKESRQFCITRNGLAFTEEEIMSWIDEDFPEKWDGYNPITDLGCYNCRHRLDWITEEMYEQWK